MVRISAEVHQRRLGRSSLALVGKALLIQEMSGK